MKQNRVYSFFLGLGLLGTLCLVCGTMGCSSDGSNSVAPGPDPDNPIVEEPSAPVTIGPGRSPVDQVDPNGQDQDAGDF